MIRHLTIKAVVTWLGIASIAVFFSTLAFFAGWRQTLVMQAAVGHRAEGQARTLSAQLVEPVLVEDSHSAFRALRRAQKADPEILYAYVLTPKGEIMAHTFAGGFPTELLALRLQNTGPRLMYRSDSGQLLDVAVPLLGGQLGYLHIGVSEEEVFREQRRFILIVAGVLTVTLAATMLVARQIGILVGRPLVQLAATARTIPMGKIKPEDVPIEGTEEVRALSGAFRDMVHDLRRLESENAAAQAKLVSAERLAVLGELSAGLAHEIMNPLDGVREACRYVKKNIPEQDRLAKYMLMMDGGLDRIEKVMRQMLQYARGSAVTLDIQAVNPKRMIEESMEMVTAQYRKRDVKLTADVPDDLHCKCDVHVVSQILVNLLLNASDACEGAESPTVFIQGRSKRDWVLLSVSDNGPGVSEKHRDRIFAPFFTTKDPDRGTGLGLAISRQAAQQCGGDLYLSEENGSLKGACIVLRLPAARTDK